MSYDKYQNWGPDLPSHTGLKHQVIIDLANSTEDFERLEILDSFEVYVERENQKNIADTLAVQLATNVVILLLSDFIKARLYKPMPVSRPRPATIHIEPEEEFDTKKDKVAPEFWTG